MKRTAGYCDGSVCQKFPILIGEFGSKLETSKDLESLGDLAKYIDDANLGWFWWSWNANSGDTGGLVSDDWIRIIWKKMDYLGKIGLESWAIGGDNSPPSPTSPIKEPTPSPAASPNPPPNPRPSNPKPSRSPCQVKIKTESVWPNGGSAYSASFKITIKNKGSREVSAPWQLTLGGGPKYSKLIQSWGWNPSLESNGRLVNGVATEDWQSMKARGGEASVGFQVTGSSEKLRPKQVRLNGVKCRVV